MKLRTTLIYLLILAALVGLTSYLQRHVKSTDERERGSRKLFQVKQDDILTLDLTGPNGSVHLEKKDNKWSILKPVTAAADETAVSTLLSELEFIQSEREIQASEFPKDADPKKLFGLEPATNRIQWTTASGPQSLWIGRKTPSGDNYYVRTSDSPTAPVYTVKSFSKTSLDKSLNDLRSRTVFDVISSDINQVSLRRASADGRSVTEHLATRSGDTWRLEKPLAVRADAAKVNSLLANVVSLRVQDFISDDSSNLSTYGLATPAGQLALRHGKETKELTLLLGSFDPKNPSNQFVKLLDGNSVFTLTKQSLDQIQNGVPELRDRKILVFDETKVTQITIETKGKKIEAASKNGVWTLSPGEVPADAEKIKAFLSRLASLQASNFVKETATDLKPYGLDKPQIRVALGLTEKDKSSSVELLLGKADKTQIFAKSAAEPFIYAVAPATADGLPQDLLAWRHPQVLNLTAAQVKQLTVIDPSGRVTRFDRTGESTFTTDFPGRAVDVPQLTNLLNVLSQLKAEKWVGETTAAQGFDRPFLTFTLILGDQTTTLKIANLQPSGNRLAQVTGNPQVFELARTDLDVLDKIPLATPSPTPSLVPGKTP